MIGLLYRHKNDHLYTAGFDIRPSCHIPGKIYRPRAISGICPCIIDKIDLPSYLCSHFFNACFFIFMMQGCLALPSINSSFGVMDDLYGSSCLIGQYIGTGGAVITSAFPPKLPHIGSYYPYLRHGNPQGLLRHHSGHEGCS